MAAGPLERGVALDAAGLGASDPDLAVQLESARLMRAAASDGRGRLEIYHDQIREAIDRQLTPDVARCAARRDRRARSSGGAAATPPCSSGTTRARAIARPPRATPSRPPSTPRSNSPSTRPRASTARRSSTTAPRWTRRDTLARLADALANAGRGPQAAATFEAAAAEAGATRQSRSGSVPREQYLVCGRLEEGKRVLMPLLARHGVRYPPTSGVALAATLGTSAPARAALLRARRPEAGDRRPPVRDADRCLHRAARGLLFVDPPRAAYFAVLSLTNALAAATRSEPDARSASSAAASLRSADPPSPGRVRCSRVRSASPPRCGIPTSTAWRSSRALRSTSWRGVSRQMLERCDRGARLLVENCRGVRWDCDVAQMGALRALEELGRRATSCAAAFPD